MAYRNKFTLVFFALLLPLLAFVSPRATSSREYEAFVRQTEHLSTVAEATLRGDLPVDSLRAAVLAIRLAYKRTAWRVEYAYPGFAAKHFNGAPLLKTERDGSQASVVPPEGLQVLDEMIFSETPDVAAMLILAGQLRNAAKQLAPALRARTFSEAETIAAVRAAIIGLPTLGLTGFDTPGSDNALPEAAATLGSLAAVFAPQTEIGRDSLGRQVLALLQHGRSLLAGNADFDAFDRLRFIREVTEPLLRRFGPVGKTLSAGPPSAVEPTATSMFSDAFLDPYAYTELTAETDNAALRKLGKTLFYDKQLSASGTLSCASCHRPDLAFTDGMTKSVLRNAPTLLNAVYADRFFYDLRAFTLEQQAEHVIFDGAEFGTAYATIVGKINVGTKYRDLVKSAFGKRDIDREGFSAALASYVLSLRSFNSPFDRYARGESEELDPAAYRGFNLFMGKAACGTCHFAPTFSGLVPPGYVENETEILGVLTSPHRLRKELDADRGRAGGGIHHEAVWIYERSFKTPTVRNAALTAPYFHHGAYATLELVVDFYNRGGGAGLGLDVPNQTLAPDPLDLTDEEQADLVAFMRSLTDAALSSR